VLPSRRPSEDHRHWTAPDRCRRIWQPPQPLVWLSSWRTWTRLTTS